MSLIYCGIKALSTRNPTGRRLFAGLPVRLVRSQEISRKASKTGQIDYEKVIRKIRRRSSPTETAGEAPEESDPIEGRLRRHGDDGPSSRKKGGRQQQSPEGGSAHPAED